MFIPVLIILCLNLVSVAKVSLADEIDVTEFIKEPYIFPEIRDGNALQPTLDLILSQKHYHNGMNKIFQKMKQKNEDAHNLKTIEAMITNTNYLINNDMEMVQGFLTTGAPDDETRREPWIGASAYTVLSSWRALKEWNAKTDGQGLDDEIAAMDKIVNLAIREMEVYEKYSDILYDEFKRGTTESIEDSDSSFRTSEET